jgi:hypothetical protein
MGKGKRKKDIWKGKGKRIMVKGNTKMKREEIKKGEIEDGERKGKKIM